MASLDYLREEMQRAFEIMDDMSRPSEVRRAARSRFWHCEKRVGAMERGGRTEDEPGHYLLGYSETGFAPSSRAGHKEESSKTYAEQRREYLDQKTEVQIAARERL